MTNHNHEHQMTKNGNNEDYSDEMDRNPHEFLGSPRFL